MKTIQKGLIYLVFLIYPAALALGQENEFISRLKTQLLLYRTQKIDQTIVIQTDKTLYRPGETIWMKGYVADAITHLLSLKSLELAVQLTDNKGVNLSEGKYPLKNGVVDCNFSIPDDLQSDVYYLIAYTPEMENTGTQAVFKKEIYIGRPEHLDMIPHLEYSKPFFAPERKETASIRLIDHNGKPLSGKKFEYQIIHEDRELLSGKGKTGSNGTGEIVFFTPSQQNGNPLMVSLDIPSGNDRLNLLEKIPLASEKININFFPDGGQRVPGIQQMVVYEVKDQLGNPENIKAEIVRETGGTVTSTATNQPGLGVFSLLNTDDKRISLRITSDIGKNQETPLPPLSPGSMSLTVKNNDGNNISLLLARSPASEPARFMIVAVSKGEMIWASDFELMQAGVIMVPLDNFHSEIADFAVFNETGHLVAHRLIYTGKSQPVSVTLFTDKREYKKGEEGVIKVKVTGIDGKPVKAEFAVSLTDRYAFPTSTGVDILKYGLDQPFPFKESIDKVNRIALDYHLATNKFKGFDWNQVVDIESSKTLNIKMVAMRISGTVMDSKNLPVPNALVSLTSSSLQQFNARTDLHGEFVINLPVSVEKKNLSASATDGSGKGNYRVILNKSFKEELANSLNNRSVNEWLILDQLNRSNYFRENPDFFKASPISKIKSGNKGTQEPYWKKQMTGNSNLLEIIKTIRPYELINGKIVFRGANSLIAQDGALLVVDGQKIGTDASQLSMVNPLDIEDIQILLNPIDISKYTSLNSVGIIEIKTKRGGTDENEPSEDEDEPKEKELKFFKPEAIGNEKYDLKTTLQWIPVLFTNEKGEATIPFKTGGIKSTFVLEIAGFTDQGLWIGNQTEIKVE